MKTSDSSGLREIYLAKRPQLLRFFSLRLRSIDAAEDLLQEMYIKLARAPAGEVENATAYLYRLGSNLMLDRLRRERRSGARETAWAQSNTMRIAEEPVVESPDADRSLDARKRLKQIVEAVQTLPPQTQRVFRLHKLEGLTHTEVAEKLGISRSAVEKHISTVLRHLLATLP